MPSSYISSFEPPRRYRLRAGACAAFVLGFLLVGAVLERVNRTFIVERSIQFRTLLALERRRETAEVLVLGDSHMTRGVDARVLGKQVVNAAIGGANYIQSYYLLRAMIDRMPALRLVVLPVELHSLSGYRATQGLGSVFWDQFLDARARREIAAAGARVRWRPFHLTVADAESGRWLFVDNVVRTVLPGASLAIETRPARRRRADRPRPPGRGGRMEQRVLFHFRDRVLPDPALRHYLERILRLCRERGVAVVTVQMPLARGYLEGALELTGGGAALREGLADPVLSPLIAANLDYMRLFPDRTELFQADGDHLRARGRRLLSARMREDLAPWLSP